MPTNEFVEKNSKQPNYPISSVGNALRLLLALKDQRRLRLSDAAREIGVSTSTAHRLLAMMQSFDFVRQEKESKTYMLGPVFLDVGLKAVKNMDIRSLARPILTDLAARLDETVHLAVLEGVNVRYVFSVEGERQLRVADRTGQVLPAHSSAMGRALLSDLPTHRLNEVLQDLTARDHSLDLDSLMEELDRIRNTGYAINARPDDVTSLAMTVQDPDGRTIAAINAAGPSSRMTKQGQKQIARHMHAAAAQIEEALRIGNQA
ncbi:IclR family transcriptional regulator [Arthrobacter crystallopoietes]|uniref:IclR family transcriptional regulator n=1 Tax=Crystallibacter crystallopoietes TaxID=37928 RepID=UPI001111130B|nr:IclR family transcriptional regulator [Arthrobacter crystallopoietes]